MPEFHGFRFRCLRCRSVLEARTDQSGRQARCPTCEALLTVPMVDSVTGRAVSDADPGDDGELPTPVHAYAAAGDMAPIIVRKGDDSLFIRCRLCDHENPVDADCCDRCGRPFTLEGAESNLPSLWSGPGNLVFLFFMSVMAAVVLAILLL